jgi:hypothetical protein
MSEVNLLDLAKGFGSAAPVIGFLLWLYYGERSERREIQKSYNDVLKDSIALSIKVQGLLERILTKLGA